MNNKFKNQKVLILDEQEENFSTLRQQLNRQENEIRKGVRDISGDRKSNGMKKSLIKNSIKSKNRDSLENVKHMMRNIEEYGKMLEKEEASILRETFDLKNGRISIEVDKSLNS